MNYQKGKWSLTVGQLKAVLEGLADDTLITCGAAATNALWPIVAVSVEPATPQVPCKLIINTNHPVTEPSNVNAKRTLLTVLAVPESEAA